MIAKINSSALELVLHEPQKSLPILQDIPYNPAHTKQTKNNK